MRWTCIAALSALMAVSSSLPVNADWRRTVFSGKGEADDVPSAHPLSYFTSNPFLRDDGDELCTKLCTPEDKKKSAEKYSVRSEVRPVGELAGYRVVEVLYYLTPRKEPIDAQTYTQVLWKSILVQVGPELYREIYHLQASGPVTSLKRSRIYQVGEERVLATSDSDGGNGGGCWEAFWWFDDSGPHALDFSRLHAAIQHRLPKDTIFSMSCSQLNLGTGQVHSSVQKEEVKCNACDSIGSVTANFQLNGFTAEPTSITFDPTNPQTTK